MVFSWPFLVACSIDHEVLLDVVVEIPDLIVGIMVTSECDINETPVELVDDEAHKVLITFPFPSTLDRLDGVVQQEHGIVDVVLSQVAVDTTKTAIDHGWVDQGDRRHLGVGLLDVR